MGYRIEFVGLINFFTVSNKERLVLLPDGTQPEVSHPGTGIPPHLPSIFVEASNVIADETDWQSVEDQTIADIGVREFRVDSSSTIRISGMEAAGDEPLDTKQFDDKMPRLAALTVANAAFEIEPQRAATIAQIPIRRGKLEARRFGVGSRAAVAVQLTVNKSPSPLTIQAVNGVTKTLTLKDGSDIVVVNMSDPFAPQLSEEEEVSHFHLYSQLEVERRDPLQDPPASVIKGLRTLAQQHPYLIHIRNAGTFPSLRCSATS